MTGQELARPGRPATVLQVINDPGTKHELARALANSGITVDYFLRVLQTHVRQSEALQKCSPASFLGSMMLSAQLHLRIGILNEAHLIPRGGEAVFQVGYRGWAELARRANGRVSCGVIYDGDEVLELDTGTDPKIRVRPDIRARHSDEKVAAVWAMVEAANGEKHLAILSTADVEEHKRRYAGKGSPAWKHDTEGGAWQAMALKTAIIRAVKYAPMSTDMERAYEAEIEAEPAPAWDDEPSAPEPKADQSQLDALAFQLERTGFVWESVPDWCQRNGYATPKVPADLTHSAVEALLMTLEGLADKAEIPAAAVSTPAEAPNAASGPLSGSDEVCEGEVVDEPFSDEAEQAERDKARLQRAEKLRRRALASSVDNTVVAAHVTTYGVTRLGQCSDAQLDEFESWLGEQIASKP